MKRCVLIPDHIIIRCIYVPFVNMRSMILETMKANRRRRRHVTWLYDLDLFLQVPLRCTCLPAYVPRCIDEARSPMLARYARPIMDYDWTCTLLEVVRTLLTHYRDCLIRFYDASGRRWHMILATDALTISIPRSADTYTCAFTVR